MISDRSSIVKIGEKEYELILTTKATKEIAKRYGGLENLGDKLMKSENFEMAISEIIWLLTLLANESILFMSLSLFFCIFTSVLHCKMPFLFYRKNMRSFAFYVHDFHFGRRSDNLNFVVLVVIGNIVFCHNLPP